MTPKGAEDGSCCSAARDGLKGTAPRPLWRRSRPLIEIGDDDVKDSLHKEPLARSSEGKK
jgi:hypothetical protein